ncbi:uncharacterized protein LOC127241932 [Andrographis paniculata]|uniref:uncharacterized protein LOC127241932 n=1 Tax=Andrographis paniculata TaxID=175694 RepID=UPI0021E999FE|nr:uncharacterized protein LOC127241932 [Andrographis paniculata]
METNLFIQLGILIFSLGIFYALQTLPKKAFSKLRSKARPGAQAHHHFIKGAQFLSKARSARAKPAAVSLAKFAVDEADKALALEPRDPAAYILKAMAQTVMGHRAAALKSLDAALSPPAAKMLSDRDKGDALLKRAELQVGLNRRRRIDSAVEDLAESVRLSPDNSKAFLLLGQCYEMKGCTDDAKWAFERALEIEPTLKEAHAGLGRLFA